MGRFVQLDQCAAGLRATVRETPEGVQSHRTDKTVLTAVKQPWMSREAWDAHLREQLVSAQVQLTDPVFAWVDHEHLGAVQHLLDGAIDVEAIRG